MWCPVLASTTGAATALQASSNTYLTGFTTAIRNCTLAQWQNALTRKSTHARETIQLPKRKTVGEPALARRAAVGNSSRAWLTRARALVPTSEEEPVRDLNHDFKELCRITAKELCHAGRPRTHPGCGGQSAARDGLSRSARQGLKPKHIEKLVAHWLAEELSPRNHQESDVGTALGRAEVGKENIVARTNAAYGIPIGCTSPTFPKQSSSAWNNSTAIAPPTRRCHCACRPPSACAVRPRSRSSRRGPIGAISLVSRNPGTRRAGDEISIVTPEQRQLLDEAKALAKGKSLVAPGYATYRDYLQHFRYECERVGIHAFHGHRHLLCPNPLPGTDRLGRARRAGDRPPSSSPPSRRRTIARPERKISREMGHGREQITAVYLGR